MPKKAVTYYRLAEALGVDEEVLRNDDAVLSVFSDFSSSQGDNGDGSSSTGAHGDSGDAASRTTDAIQKATDIAAMWSSGETCEEDMDAVMQKIQEAYWEGKRKRRG